MIALVATVVGSSLAGSIHCAAMCGPLQGLALDPSLRPAARWRVPFAHAGGRLAAYVTLGAIAGGIGAVLELAGSLLQIQRAAMALAAVAVIAWGALALASAFGYATPSLRPRLWTRAVVRLRPRRPTARAVVLGLLSAALPCGWLWAFVIIAAGTGGAATGALVMAGFWLGTVPMMVGLGAVLGPLARRLGARMPVVTALALIAVGVVALQTRLPLLSAPASASARPACHGDGP